MGVTAAVGATALPLALTAAADAATNVDWVGPIAGTGMVGIFLLLVLLRIKIMPTYVYDEAKEAWAAERARLEADIAELKGAVRTANEVYTAQVIPTLTRVLDAERELVDLRRDEQMERRRRRAVD